VWNVLSLPDGTEHFDRFGVFSLYVVKDRTTRDRLLRKSENDRAPLKPNAEGIAFRLSGATDSYSAVQRFDENIVLVWQAGDSPKVDDSYRRLATAVEASVTGDESKIPAAQRDCKQAGIDPVSGKEGECRVGDRVVDRQLEQRAAHAAAQGAAAIRRRRGADRALVELWRSARRTRALSDRQVHADQQRQGADRRRRTAAGRRRPHIRLGQARRLRPLRRRRQAVPDPAD